MDVYRTDWRNIGVWLDFTRSFGIRTPWGNVIVKRWSDRLFSERYTTNVPQFKLGPLCLSWRRLRHYRDMSEAIAGIVPQETPLMAHLRKRL